MNTAEQLTQVFYNNFTAYYRSHVAHANIVGRNFHSDHKLLQKIYEDLQDQIDVIAELLRTIGEFMPSEVQFVLNESTISTAIFEGDSTELLAGVKDDLETLKGFYEDLMEEAELDGHKEIANYAQERILAIAKFVWMLNATLD
jgi:starvation-inducible DNA-binding protein